MLLKSDAPLHCQSLTCAAIYSTQIADQKEYKPNYTTYMQLYPISRSPESILNILQKTYFGGYD